MREWITNETWMTLDPFSRGVFVQLWLWMVSNKKNISENILGSLPVLLQIDSIPEEQIIFLINQHEVNYEKKQGEKIQRWFWKNFWWPKFKEMLILTTDEHEKSEWKAQWYEVQQIEEKNISFLEPENINNFNKKNKTRKIKSDKKNKIIEDRKKIISKNQQILISSALPKNEQHNNGEPWGEGQSLLSYNEKTWLNKEEIYSRWMMPLNNKQEKFFLWEEGPKMLTDLPQKQAISFLSKMIKQYGEINVAKSLTVLALKNPKPLSPTSFLRGVITNEVNGFDDEKLERENKGGLVL